MSRRNLRYHKGYGSQEYTKLTVMGLDPRFSRGIGRRSFLYTRRNITPINKIPTYKRNITNYRLIREENFKKNDNIIQKIEEIEKKIKEEIESRKDFIGKCIPIDKFCFMKTGSYYKLKNKFLNYLVGKSKYILLKRRKFKKTLKNIRFNLNKEEEDIIIHKEGGIIIEDRYKSVLKSDTFEWKKCEKIIRLIGRNIEDFKLFSKKKKLEKLYSEYERIAYLNHEEGIIICEKCGSENLKKANYCHNCGKSL